MGRRLGNDGRWLKRFFMVAGSVSLILLISVCALYGRFFLMGVKMCIGRCHYPAGYVSPTERLKKLQAQRAQMPADVSGMANHSRSLLEELIATNYVGSMELLRSLPIRLSSENIEQLRDVLAISYNEEMSVTSLEFNGVKNVTASLLLQQIDFPPELLLDFDWMFGDSTYDNTWRDYCLQMLGAGVTGLSVRGDDSDSCSLCSAIAVSTLHKASEMKVETWSGTALLGLDSIASATTNIVSRNEVVKVALAIANDSSAAAPSRVTAIRLAGRYGDPRVLGVARNLAYYSDERELKAAAVATLGDVGNSDDLKYLYALSDDQDAWLADVARSTSKVLQQRLGK